MEIKPFALTRLPRIRFGAGVFARVPELIHQYGSRALIVTGGRALRETLHWGRFTQALSRQHIEWQTLPVSGEPSPELVDEAVARFRETDWSVVVGIGGGSVLDTAKAIAGLLPSGDSVMDYLEGVGPERPYQGPPVPYIAVPTTAGTGSEATRNAVLSRQGPGGFKKSFRHEQLVPEHAVVDPELLASCPPALIAANGMDALTQLLESYTSLNANPFTDALARSGLEAVRDGLLPWYQDPAGAGAARSRMAYGALLSGITLAQCGLGSVHGLASPLGAFFPIPHGVVCGTLVAACTAANIQAMNEREPDNPALKKYAEAGRLLAGRPAAGDEEARRALVERLEDWTRRLGLEPLSAAGVGAGDIDRIVAHCRGSSMKTNPVVLTDSEIADILAKRI